MSEQEGPSMSCIGCKWHHNLLGGTKACGHPSVIGWSYRVKEIGRTYTTPDWCPSLKEAEDDTNSLRQQ